MARGQAQPGLISSVSEIFLAIFFWCLILSLIVELPDWIIDMS